MAYLNLIFCLYLPETSLCSRGLGFLHKGTGKGKGGVGVGLLLAACLLLYFFFFCFLWGSPFWVRFLCM